MMALCRDPWSLLERLHDADNISLLSSVFRGGLLSESGNSAYHPSVDIETRDNHYLLQIDMPGIQLKDMEITTD